MTTVQRLKVNGYRITLSKREGAISLEVNVLTNEQDMFKVAEAVRNSISKGFVYCEIDSVARMGPHLIDAHNCLYLDEIGK